MLKLKPLLAISSLSIIMACSKTNVNNGSNAGIQISPLSAWSKSCCVVWYNPSAPNDSQIDIMAHAKAVILDIELCDKDIINKLKSLNGNLKIGIYFNPMEIFTIEYPDRPWQNQIRKDLLNNYDHFSSKQSFFVYDPTHTSKRTWWVNPPMWLMNLSSTDCPLINGTRYVDYIAANITNKIFAANPFNGNIDFVMIDNCLRDIAWMGNRNPPGAIDINWNGTNDFDEVSGVPFTHQINVDWREGITTLCNKIKSANPMVEIIGNQPNEYFNTVMNGKVFEYICPNPSISGPTTYRPYGATWDGENFSTYYDCIEVMENYLFPINLSHNLFLNEGCHGENETALAISLLYDNTLAAFGLNSTDIPDFAKTEIGNPAGPMSTNADGLKIRIFDKAIAVFNKSFSPISYNGTIIGANSGKLIKK
jgi:hypothetical protein